MITYHKLFTLICMKEIQMQQSDFVGQWSKICKCAAKPFTELAALNLNTLNEWTQHIKLDEMPSKKPEDFVAMQTKITNEAIKTSMTYAQKAFDIFRESSLETGKVFNDMLQETASKVSSGTNIFGKQTGSSRPSESEKTK